MAKNRNRTAGHAFERRMVKLFKALGWPNAITSRLESRQRDNDGVDLCYTDPFAIQCKSSIMIQNYHKVITGMKIREGEIPILIHEYREKKKSRFYKIDDYVVIKLTDFEKICQNQKNIK